MNVPNRKLRIELCGFSICLFNLDGVVGGAGVALDLSGVIDVAAERKRLTKDLGVAQKEKEQAEKKLGNEAFLAKAPEKVVVGIRSRLTAAEADIARIAGQLGSLPEA